MWQAERKLNQLVFRGRRTSQCSICLNKLTGGTKKLNPCGHQFHRKCIKQWIRTNNTCPLCRIQINQEQLNELRFGVGGNILQVEYGRSINAPLPSPRWEQNEDDAGHARGNLFLVHNEQLQRALSYLVLSQYLRNDFWMYWGDDNSPIHEDSTPDTVGYDQIMWAAQLNFTCHDWSEALLGYEGDIRPPFSMVEQLLDDGIEYEHLQINDNALLLWWETNREAVIHEFNEITSRA